jgi:hypothetical protein
MTRINQRRYTIDEELQKLDDIMLNGDLIANMVTIYKFSFYFTNIFPYLEIIY